MKKTLLKSLVVLTLALTIVTGLFTNKKISAASYEETIEAVLNKTTYDVDGDNQFDPVYEISNKEQLLWFIQLINSGRTNFNAILLEDITFNEITFTEYGVSSSDKEKLVDCSNYFFDGFTGDFNGNGKTISGFYTLEKGLFDSINVNGRVHDLNLVNSLNESRDYYASLLTSSNFGTIENCYFQGYVFGNTYAGGIAGYNADFGVIRNCIVNTYVSTDFRSANIASYNRSVIENCISIGGNISSYGITSDKCGKNNYFVNGHASAEGNGLTDIKVTLEQLKSGEVVWLFNNGVTDGTQTLYQTIGTSDIRFTGETVYYGYESCLDNQRVYSNSYKNYNLPHKYTDVTYENEHSHVCDICLLPSSDNEILYDNSCDTICNICNYERTITHTIGEYQYNDSVHWNDCAVCGEEIVREAHQFENYVCIICNNAQKPILVTNENFESLGLTSGHIGYYAIATEHQFKEWYETNNYTNVVLIADIVGLYYGDDSKYSHYGVFDGNGHTVTMESYYFIDYNYGMIKNVMFRCPDMTSICYENFGKIENCFADARGDYNYHQYYMFTESSISGDIVNSYFVGLEIGGITITNEMLRSGEITHLLNNGVTDGTQVFYQTIGVDYYPKSSGATVYKIIANCKMEGYVFSNTTELPTNVYHSLGALNEALASKCFENGHIAYYECENCGKLFDEELNNIEEITIYSCKHEVNGFVKWTDEVSPTCFENGTIGYYFCENCEIYYNYDLEEVTDLVIYCCNELGHVHYVERVAPTLEADGHEAHLYCEVCKATYDLDNNVYDPKLEQHHIWSTWLIYEEATAEKEGLAYRYCKHCMEVEERVIPVRDTSSTCKALSLSQVISYMALALSTTLFVVFRKRK